MIIWNTRKKCKVPILSEEMQMFIEVGKLVSYQRAQLTKQGKKLSPSGSRDISGRATENVLREHLIKHGLNISNTRVGIEGAPLEIDLISLKLGINPAKTIYYPHEVDTVLEIKNNAVADQTTEIKKNFNRLKQLTAAIWFAAIVLSEREGYKYAIREEQLGYPVFTLICRTVSAGRWMWSESETVIVRDKIMSRGKRIGRKAMQETGEWQRLLDYLRTRNAKSGMSG